MRLWWSKLLIVQPLRKGIDDTKENDEVIVALTP